MIRLTDYPLLSFSVALIVLWSSAKFGARFAHRVEDVREDLDVILKATLTLLGLIVGFTFSMALGRYDQRKLYEEEEANAIGTEYARSELLSASEGENVRKLLREYVDLRVLFYQTRNSETLRHIDAATAQLQRKLWESVKSASQPQQTPITAPVVSGMNDVLNSQGYTRAAWSNRIPRAAWVLLDSIAIFANVMFGLSLRSSRSRRALIAILPAIVSLSLFLIAEIDSPVAG